MLGTFAARALIGAAAGAFLLAAMPATAQTKWDFSIPWGPSEFHSVNAQKFAERVKKDTNGALVITVHTGGSLGIKANESVRAVSDGLVPIAEFAAFQNVGEIPILGIESLPFLIDDYAQLKIAADILRPIWASELEKRGQRILYSVPWPSQNFFVKKAIASTDDLKGLKMRTYDKMTTEMVTRIGMVPLQMNNADIIPSLASGKLDAVMTSGTTAVAQKYWEFLSHAYSTNHLWASNIVTVNNDAWNKLTADQKAAVERAAKEMEPGFWEVSKGEHELRMKQLADNGMKVAVATPELRNRLREVTRSQWDEFAKTVPGAAKVLAEYRQKTGK